MLDRRIRAAGHDLRAVKREFRVFGNNFNCHS
jgi:hypothetical protein